MAEGGSGPPLDEMKSILKALTMSVQYGLPLDQVETDYEEAEGRSLRNDIAFYGIDVSQEDYVSHFLSRVCSDSLIIMDRKTAALEVLKLPWPPTFRARDRGGPPPAPLQPENLVVIAMPSSSTNRIADQIRNQRYTPHTRLGGIVVGLSGDRDTRRQASRPPPRPLIPSRRHQPPHQPPPPAAPIARALLPAPRHQ